jgi:nucleotide-binding universal stress UspA family protein
MGDAAVARSFLVVLEENADALIPYALSAAKTLGAFPTAIYPRRDKTGLEDGSLEARVEAASGSAEARKTQAQTALAAFAKAAADAGVEAEILEPEVGQDPPRDIVPRFARAFDYTMMQQRSPGQPPPRDDLAAALLEDSGRPVVIVPAIQRDSIAFKRILVAWDGSVSAARAFSEARGLFALAERVEVVTVVRADTPHAVIQGGLRLGKRLERAGVSGEFRRLPSDEDPGNALLSYAADIGADLLVAGGYGHSPLRETLFGGVTRTLLTSMTLPLVLVH